MFIEPVFGKKFFGREEVLGTLQKRVTALKGGYRQNLALTGPMLAGKSSVLRHFLKSIKDPGIIPLYIEMSGEDFHVFCMQFMVTLLYRYLKTKAQKVEDDFELLKKACCEMIPETVHCMEDISKALKQKKNDIAYEKLLTLTSVFKKETDKSCIVILDEFQNLSNFHLKKPFQIFGKLIMVQKNTMYIVSSSQKTLLHEILSRKLSLLFGNFEVIEIDGFDSQTALSFISDKIKDFGSYKSICGYLIQVSQGNPFYLEVLANRFSEMVKQNDPKRDAKECFLESFAERLYVSDGVLNQYFTNNVNFFLEKKSRKKFIPILLSLARGKSTIKTIQSDLGKIDKELGYKLQKLESMDIIYNSGVFYKISDKLFEYWLRYVYNLKTRSMIDDMDMKYLEFKHSVEEDYKAYCEFSSKNIETIVVDLFKSFRNEKIKVFVNYRKMPHFDTVESKILSENIFQVIGRIKNKKWICFIKQDDMISEGDVHSMLDLKKRSKDAKSMQKILIPLKGIGENAFLLAKEQSVWVWDVAELNRILRLYRKFELVP